MRLLERVRRIRHSPLDIAISAAILLLGLPLLLGGLALAGIFLYFFILPPPVRLPEPKASSTARTSHVYAADGSLIAILHSEHNREPVHLDAMSIHLQQAAVAAEDSRFYSHTGLDLESIFRAFAADLRSGRAIQGGSTITQQYVKNAYVGSQRTLFRKVREALLASQLEHSYSKRKILERYLNTVYFGRGAYGAEAAAKTYFQKKASGLSISESALLVGLIPGPVAFSPYDHPSEALIRRRLVIDRMLSQHMITSGEAEEAKRDKLDLADPSSKEEVFRFPWFVDAVKHYIENRYGEVEVFTGGLDVYTTLDPKIQDLAEKSVKDVLPSPDDPYASVVVVEPGTGFVRALVGGRDYSREKFNLAIQARRQPGSAFKPFVLVAALESGILPTRYYSGPGVLCVKGWKPDCHVTNYDQRGYGYISVEQATYNSVNTVYAQLIMDVGPEKVVEAARRMGIPGPGWLPQRSPCKRTSSDACQTRIEPFPALALGSEEVTPLELASAYATLPAHGEYRAPKVVEKIMDSSGEVLEEGPSDPVRAIPADVADNATRILREVITRGTGKRADIGRPAAGKTGTASDYENAWFSGYTPDLAAAVWLGFKESNRPLLNIEGTDRVTGGTLPARIWAELMRGALADRPPVDFAAPQPLESALQLPYHPPPSPDVTDTATPAPSPPATESVTPSPSPSPSSSPPPSPTPSPPPPSPTPSPPPPSPTPSPTDHPKH